MNGNFSVTVRVGSLPGVTVLSISGPVVLEHLVAFQEIWDSRPQPFLILDVSHLSQIDSAAIGFLVNAYVTREKKAKKLALAGVHGVAERLLNLSRISTVIKTYATVADAEASFRQTGAASA